MRWHKPYNRRAFLGTAAKAAAAMSAACGVAREAKAPLSRKRAIALLQKSIPVADIRWLREATRSQLEGCRLRAKDGTALLTPDGSGHYRALWTRDFEYMVAGAPDLIEADLIRRGILFLLRGQRDDGCMPDRVTAEGRAVYSPGAEDAPLADHALDNGPFMAKLVADYVAATGDLGFFRRCEPALRNGLDFVRRAENGLVYNDPGAPQCPYGFTDTVAKTGHLLFTSLLYYDACQRMAHLAERASCGRPETYRKRADLIRRNIGILWDEGEGIFLAADRDCKQPDIWGSALAVDLGLAGPERSARIVRYLYKHASAIFKRGQVRHLPAPQTWERTFVAVKPGTYQNGAYWATPLAWLLPAVARRIPDFAAKLLKEAVSDFRTKGIFECVNDHYGKVPNYVVSATNTYAIFSQKG